MFPVLQVPNHLHAMSRITKILNSRLSILLKKTLKSLDNFVNPGLLVQEKAFASFTNSILFILFWKAIHQKLYSDFLYCNFKLAVTFEYLFSDEFSFFSRLFGIRDTSIFLPLLMSFLKETIHKRVNNLLPYDIICFTWRWSLNAEACCSCLQNLLFMYVIYKTATSFKLHISVNLFMPFSYFPTAPTPCTSTWCCACSSAMWRRPRLSY